MSDLIRKSDLIDWLRGKRYITVDETSDIMSEDFENKHRWELSRNCFINDTIKYIQEQPTIEAEPVVHGWWILKDDHGSGVCSNCHRQDKIDPLAGFCRYCGARMDGGVNDDIPKGN